MAKPPLSLTPAEQALRDARSSTTGRGRGKIAVAPTKPLANQHDLSLAYSPGVAYACLAIEEDRARGRVHLAREPGRRGHQRHRGAGAGRHRAARRQAGDGGQGLPVQEVRRHRRLRHRARREGPRQAGRDHRRARADARRHQSRGHQAPECFDDREEAARAAEDPGVPRRPARHRDHLGGGAAEQPRAHRPPHRGDACLRLGRGRGGDRVPRPDGRHGGARGERRRGRLQGRRAHRPRRSRPVQAALRPQRRTPARSPTP